MHAEIAIVGMMMLASAPLRAGGPSEFQRPLPTDRSAQLAVDTILGANIAPPLALLDGSHRATGAREEHSNGNWSPRVANWNRGSARRLGSGLEGLLDEHSLPVSVFGQPLVLSR